MEKSRINRFVSKYNLAGLVESVKWESKDGSLTTSFISDDKSVLGTVSLSDFDFEDTSFGVYDTSKLTKMLGVLSNDIEFDVTKTDDKAISLQFKDGATSVNYMLADLSVIPSVPDLKQLPDFNITINLDDTFINRFIRAKSAIISSPFKLNISVIEERKLKSEFDSTLFNSSELNSLFLKAKITDSFFKTSPTLKLLISVTISFDGSSCEFIQILSSLFFFVLNFSAK